MIIKGKSGLRIFCLIILCILLITVISISSCSDNINYNTFEIREMEGFLAGINYVFESERAFSFIREVNGNKILEVHLYNAGVEIDWDTCVTENAYQEGASSIVIQLYDTTDIFDTGVYSSDSNEDRYFKVYLPFNLLDLKTDVSSLELTDIGDETGDKITGSIVAYGNDGGYIRGGFDSFFCSPE